MDRVFNRSFKDHINHFILLFEQKVGGFTGISCSSPDVVICDPGVISSFDAYYSSKESNVYCVDSQDLLLLQCKTWYTSRFVRVILAQGPC